MRLNGIQNKNKNKNQSIESNVSSKDGKRFENIDCCSCLLAFGIERKKENSPDHLPFTKQAKTNNDHMNMKIHKPATATTKKIW